VAGATFWKPFINSSRLSCLAMAATPKPQRKKDDRGGDRLALDLPTRLRPNDWSSLEVRMIDLSSRGFRAACEARLQRGACVSLDVAGLGSLEAQIEWQRGTMFGARFLHPIALEQCAWSHAERQSVLARLLVERAEAHQAGAARAERALRRRILENLPIHRGSAAA